VVAKDSPLKSPADLKGRKISFTTPQSTSQGLDALLVQKFNFAADDVSLVATGPYGAAIAALTNGGVDVAILAEPVYTLNQDRLRSLAWVRDLFPAINNVVRSVMDELPDHPSGGVPFWSAGEFNPADMDAMMGAMKLMGLPEADADWRRLVDRDFPPADLRRDLGKRQ
jgi:NitT/TauT family transport system substrate-binding protein